jgi:hypothetical protein
MNIGMMEGCLTLPLLKETKFQISNLYDWDPRIEHVKWWDGAVLVPGDTTSTRYRTGFDNHAGIDYSIEVGSPIVAPAPGIARDRQIGPQGQLGITVDHDTIRLRTFYNHLSRITVQEAQRVSRGQKFAESGEPTPGTPSELFSNPIFVAVLVVSMVFLVWTWRVCVHLPACSRRLGWQSVELYTLELFQRYLGSWVYPAERTAGAVDPLNLIQAMLAKEGDFSVGWTRPCGVD